MPDISDIISYQDDSTLQGRGSAYAYQSSAYVGKGLSWSEVVARAWARASLVRSIWPSARPRAAVMAHPMGSRSSALLSIHRSTIDTQSSLSTSTRHQY
ncbi:hypothetical protein EW145_g2237 [Phellinidium pouzarii]|uniref:Uncharacterized protein n=1 Tax=Phellinidium pouzarii TaxID=167371 RepID=A0A4V3XDC2_9AGAM|nr:hypothetical protein EW145_g2237 [Phellinidium pouzarii]